MGVSRFTLDLKQFGKLTREQTGTVVRKVSMDLLRSVVMLTPVDTGRARANWQVAIGEPAGGWEEYSGGPGAAAARAINAGTATIERIDVGEDVVVSITNNVPYIERLEDGSSDQAPNGMVRQSVAQFPYLVEEAAR